MRHTQTHAFVKGSPGLLFEERLLGDGITDFIYKNPPPEKIPYNKALEIALSRETQKIRRWDIHNPPTPAAFDLLVNVKDSLRQSRVRHSDRVEMFSTIGTVLDRHYMTDLLFKFSTVIITVDLTVSHDLDKVENNTQSCIASGESRRYAVTTGHWLEDCWIDTKPTKKKVR